ncbi:MAG: metallopeptidase family protein [Desulfobacteraceae bacterium]|nr:MAG: metallopeptidase family protein [Desulfobacteraceae bacterium]
MKLSSAEFDRIVEKALDGIPPEIHRHLENILISVQKQPSKTLLEEMGLPAGRTLLGLYSGVSRLRRSVTYPPLFPDTIFLFQEPIESQCRTLEELEEQIRVTLVHEVAHALGMSEKELQDLGYG